MVEKKSDPRKGPMTFRATDRGFWDKTGAFFQRYAGAILLLTPLATVLVTVLTMMGWGVITPDSTLKKMAEVDRRLSIRLDSTNIRLNQHIAAHDSTLADLNIFVEALAIGQCLDRTDEELLRMRLMAWCASQRGGQR